MVGSLWGQNIDDTPSRLIDLSEATATSNCYEVRQLLDFGTTG
jgi:hypothetical protein